MNRANEFVHHVVRCIHLSALLIQRANTNSRAGKKLEMIFEKVSERFKIQYKVLAQGFASIS